MTIDVNLYSDDNDLLVDCAFARRLEKTALTGATVNVTVRDAAGVDVTGVSWPLALSGSGLINITHPDGSTVSAARYVGTIQHEADIVAGKVYRIEIRLTHAGDGLDAQWLIDRVARRLGS